MNHASRPLRIAAVLAAASLLAAVPLLAQVEADREAPVVGGAAVEGVISSVVAPASPSAGPVVSILDGLIAIDTTGAAIKLPSGEPGSTADLRVGARIAALLKSTTPPLAAQTIWVFASQPEAVLRGTVEAVDLTAKTFQVLGLTVKVTDRTSFGGPRDGTGVSGLADLRVGDPVTVAAVEAAGAITATRVLVMGQPPEPVERLRGTVKTIGTTSWTITEADGRDRAVTVTADTRIVGDPVVGDQVEVVGRSDSAGGFVAQLIAKLPAAPPVLERLRGTVKSIANDAWVITTARTPSGADGTDVRVLVNAQTRIVGDPRVGDTVDVLGTRDSTGGFLAQVISKVVVPIPTPDATVTGVVRSIEGTVWTVGDVKVLVSPMTRIVGSPRVGDTVKATGMRMPDGSLMAKSIEKVTSTTGG